MDNIQTNTKEGALTLPTAQSLSGKNGMLVKMTAGGLALPTAASDDVLYAVVNGGETEAGVKPLHANEQIRVFLKGSCNAGDRLALATPSEEDAGKVAAISAPGTYASVGIAEESGVDGQAVLVRANFKSITIS